MAAAPTQLLNLLAGASQSASSVSAPRSGLEPGGAGNAFAVLLEGEGNRVPALAATLDSARAAGGANYVTMTRDLAELMARWSDGGGKGGPDLSGLPVEPGKSGGGLKGEGTSGPDLSGHGVEPGDVKIGGRLIEDSISRAPYLPVETEAGGFARAVPTPVGPGEKTPEAPVSETPAGATRPDRHGVEPGDVKITGRVEEDVLSSQPVLPAKSGAGPERGLLDNTPGNDPVSRAPYLPDESGLKRGEQPAPVQPGRITPEAPVSETPDGSSPADRQGVELKGVEIAGRAEEDPVSSPPFIPGKSSTGPKSGEVSKADGEVIARAPNQPTKAELGRLDPAAPQPVEPGKTLPEAPVSQTPDPARRPDRAGVELDDVDIVARGVSEPSRGDQARPSEPGTMPDELAEIFKPDLTAKAAATTANNTEQASAQLGVSDPQAFDARTPGDLVREAARSARAGEASADPHTGSRTGEPAQRAASEPGVQPTTMSKAGSAPAMAQGFAPSPLAALMASQAGLANSSVLMQESPAVEAAELEAQLNGELQGLRNEMRADAARQALPQAAVAGKFTPQTVQNLAARIAARQADGARVFDIRMDPPELGRVEVRLEVGADKAVRAHLTAERADTLAELQRYARDLERALEAAGLQLDAGGLDFSLRQDGGFDRPAGEGTNPSTRENPVFSQDETILELGGAATATVYGFELAARRGLDVRT